MDMGLLDLITEWFIKPIVNKMYEWINSFVIINGVRDVFYVERLLGIDSSVLWGIQMTVAGFAMALISAKLLHKLLNIYILGTDGDDSTPPMEYVRSYIKAVAIVACFTVVYTWIGDIVESFAGEIMQTVGQQSWENVATGAGTFTLLFSLIYFIVVLVFYVNLIITGIRMLFLRMALPLSCVGLIDNDNGIYSVFIKKMIQTASTVVAQVALMQISILPLKHSTGSVVDATFIPYILSTAVLVYAMKLPQDMNEIFLAAPNTGAGQKISAVGRGLQTAVSFFSRGAAGGKG